MGDERTYRDLFKEEDKAAAFDKIAEQFYERNFGRMSKSDMEILMFSIYIEQILARNEYAFNAYSDYRLAEALGVPQSKISSLKIKKQMRYPHEFDWKKSFEIVSKNARYENGKIIIQIPDINLYDEIKNVVEANGGYVSVTLTKNLFKITPEYFIGLMMAALEEEDRNKIRKKLRDEFRKQGEDQEYMDTEPIVKILTKLGKESVKTIFLTISSEKSIGVIADIVSRIWNIIEKEM